MVEHHGPLSVEPLATTTLKPRCPVKQSKLLLELKRAETTIKCVERRNVRAGCVGGGVGENPGVPGLSNSSSI